MVIYQNLSQNQKRKNKTIKNQMTFLYTRTNSWNSTPQEKPTEQTIKVLETYFTEEKLEDSSIT